MSVRLEAPSWVPDVRWWIGLALVMAAGLVVNWGVAAALLVLILVQEARPLDFVPAFLMAVTAAAFVFNEGGGLVFQLGMVTLVVLFMLGCYAIQMARRSFTLSTTGLTAPLLTFLLLSLVNSMRQTGTIKDVGLELMPILGLGSALLVANAFEARRDLGFALAGMIVVGYGVAVWGFYVFVTVGAHTVGFYSMAIPGLAGVLLFNLALRSKAMPARLGWLILSIPLFVHQFVTFGRGLWTGCIAGVALSAMTYAGFGRGSGASWRRVGAMLGMFAGFAVGGAILAAILLGHTSLLTEAATRFNSIGAVDTGYGTRSNAIRLWEYGRVLGLIQGSPFVGHGVGYSFTLKDPFTDRVTSQWGVHQNFLLVWLKQGLIGLAVFVWMLAAAIRLGVREARRRADPLESAWFGAMAAATAFLIVFSLSNFPFARVNETFYLASLWGGAMAMARKGTLTLRWSPRGGSDGGTMASGASLPPPG